MQEGFPSLSRFEFDIVCGKTNGSTFEKIYFFHGILGVCLTWLDCITIFFGIIFGSNSGAN